MSRPLGSKNKYHRSLIDRFWEKVDRQSDNECWNWLAFVHPSGYGMIAKGNNSKIMLFAHRVSWEIAFGSIPNKMLVCHKCDNRICVNPKHLFLGTFQENIDDREHKQRGKIPDNRGERHGLHKLTEQNVRDMRSAYNGGCAYDVLSKRFGVSKGAVREIVHYRRWSWLESV